MAQPQERRPPRSAEYYYRRSLGAHDLIPAVAAGVGAGLLAFYVARLLAERTPLVVERGTRPAAADGTPARERGVGRRRSG